MTNDDDNTSVRPLDPTLAQAIREGKRLRAQADERSRAAAKKWAYGEQNGQPSALVKLVTQKTAEGLYEIVIGDRFCAEYAAELGLKVKEIIPLSFRISWE